MQKKANKITLWIFLSILANSLIYQNVYSQELLQSKHIEGIGQFYREPTGTVAFLPYADTRDDAKNAVVFEVLQKSGAYRLRWQPEYWFIVNHRTTTEPETTYLGIEIIKIFEKIPIKVPVWLMRSEKWYRESDQSFNGVSEVKKGFPDKKIDDFINYHAGDKTLLEVDKYFDFKWHGTPQGSTKHSWEKAKLWSPPLLPSSETFRNMFSPLLPKNSKMLLNGLLIRFSTTTKIRTNKPLIFHFKTGVSSAAYVNIFSPDSPEFNKDYFLRFK